ncbi:helix-turn-helix domain-containing protein [Thermogymnomonas acidicola]|uniref:helix-turn-helix domain-containing protein n=1 Tax=Thermogymnomonas acidicola TaxID=399579 RepID=UPI0009467B11|nr:helix-turn-helix domain-containing protein [Thermogymnomonas acidicola]
MAIESLRLVLRHEGDWTQGTESFPDLSIHSLGYVLNMNGKNVEYMQFSDRKGNLKDIAKSCKGGDVRIQVVRKTSGGGAGEMILVGDYRESLRRVMNELGVIALGLTVRSGVEIYLAAFDSTSVSRREVIDALTDFCDIVEISRVVERRPLCLTEDEERVLKIAINNGFFDTPRKITLTEISQITRASKSTVNYRLKSAIRKVIGERDRLMGDY